jgi:D-xylose transport system substrate-binding protein
VPTLVGPDKVETVVTAGDASASDICNTAEQQAACTKYGVK